MEDKIYFLPGDTVKIRQLRNSPEMLVIKKVTNQIKVQGVSTNFFQGILCKWFTSDGFIQESVFNTKDLLKITPAE